MAAPNRHTLTSSLTTISAETRTYLDDRGLRALGDFEDVDLAPLFKYLTERSSAKDARALFKVLVGSGVSINLDSAMPIENLGLLSKPVLKKLENLGLARLSDFSDKYFPDVNAAIGYNQGKPLLIALVSAGIKVHFKRPEFDEAQWQQFVTELVATNVVQWEDVAIAVLGELNPPQVGTAVANAVKHNYPKRETMREVWKWFYAQSGKCEVSGKRLFLEADHRVPKEVFLKSQRDVKEADTLDNFQLLTKRENVIKRGSHRLGGISFANASAVLMFVLFTYKPKTIKEFEALCREYGLTMSGIRFQEAWAMAVWLSKEGLYELDEVMGDPLPDADIGEDDATELAEL